MFIGGLIGEIIDFNFKFVLSRCFVYEMFCKESLSLKFYWICYLKDNKNRIKLD